MVYRLIQGMIGKLVFWWLSSLVMLRADPAPQGILQQGVLRFQEAYRTWDSKGFNAASIDFKQAVTQNPKSATCRYWLGTTHFHRMLQLQNRDSGQADLEAGEDEMQKAIDALEAALEIDPNHAEVHAILGTLYGMKINGSLLRAIRYGPSVQNHQKQALHHGAKNPRVQYLLGTGMLHTASNDADRIEALKSLLLAEALFDAEEKQDRNLTDPRWGKDVCLTFIGQTFAQLHKPGQAKDYFQKALLARPNNLMAKSGLAKLNAR